MTEIDIPRIVTAEASDAKEVETVLTAAFLDGDLASWLIADRHERVRIYPGYFLMIAEHAIEHGQIEMTADGAAVALWYSIGDELPPPPTGYHGRLSHITDPYTARFVWLDEAMEARHPRNQPHAYLSHLAVHPFRHGLGLGSHLLRNRHAELDRSRTPAYLEATGLLNERLYLRHGYRSRKPVPISPNGPSLYPMWRLPGALGPKTIRMPEPGQP